MIDIHSHIIPGIDDGARSMDMALEMAQQAVDVGVKHLVCTPHIHWGTFDNTLEIIEQGFNDLQSAVTEAKIPLALSWAGEVRVNEMVPIWFKQQKLPFIGEFRNKKVLLLEMPHSNMPAGLEQLFRWLLNAGIQPLIPHPERNRDVWKRPDKIQWLRNQGCLLQVTAGAFTGRFGDNVQRLAMSMLKDHQIDFVASDTHDIKRRPNDMGEAYNIVSRYASKDEADKLFIHNPGHIVGVETQ
ncbi:tyrosine-protein phosphatase [Alteromonas sp. 14N.309.X.WAT.G.H12]|uniref:tyrosine-protein phosphatase n=1 Tax=Alteromonas sp. 14N.309.X.WAT.G.H12 TaxID=3120824 RepID=UPI002FCF9D14